MHPADREPLARLAAGSREAVRVLPPAGPPRRGRRSAGWGDDDVASPHVASAPGRDDPVAGLRPAAGLRGRLRERLPQAWQESRWALPRSAGVVAVVAAAVAVVVVVAVALVVAPRDAPEVQTVPARGDEAPAAAPGDAAVPGDAAAPAPSPTDPFTVPPSGPAPAGTAPPWGAAAGGPGGQDAALLVVHVVGQVGAPGVVRLPAGARVADAVEAAGGLTEDADVTRVNLARLVVDGEQVVVPRPGEELPPPAPGAAAGGPGDGGTPGGSGAIGGAEQPVDLNTATAEQLDTLPGVGPVLSGRILDWRAEHGRFSRVEELLEVPGIGPTLLERLRPLVRV